MTPEQQAAYVIAQTALALITVEGMKIANSEAIRYGHQPHYVERSFKDEADALRFTIRPYVDSWK